MKTVLFILLVFVCGLLMAEISPFALVGSGNYAGKLATYARGDTIVFVTKPSIPNIINYKFSFDGGVSWQTMDFSYPLEDSEFAPTLSYTLDEAIVSFKNGNQNMIATSNNGGPINLYEPFPDWWLGLARTYDKSPYVERVNGQLWSFSLEMPYPDIAINSGHQGYNPFVGYGNPEEYLAPFYFTDTDQSPHEQPVYFTGSDVITGIVRSNSDICIRQTSGLNNGWPTFLAPVVTSGTVRSYPDGGHNYPEDDVFTAGLYENAPYLGLRAGVSYGANAGIVGPPTYNPNNIVMVTVNGDSYTAMLGTISIPSRTFADVWTNYPYGTGVPPSFRNNFTVCDTMWTALPGGNCANQKKVVKSKLWIRGQFSGHQTWCSADSIYIIGDITLSNTPPGTAPYPTNTTDSVSLIADKSILLKYGYKDPVDSLRYHPLCRADSDPIYIYASLYALGRGMGNAQKDGVFTFEYQHPHGSIPATTINTDGSGDTLFNWIDLHRNRWPQTASQPWPPLIDFPWYNPLWPEKAPYLERGTVQLWGSVVQRRRGFMHRGYSDSEWPSMGLWNVQNDYCGGTSAPNQQFITLYQNPNVSVTLQTRNFPGATGTGVGYKKNYNWDRRSRLSDGWDENSSTSVWPLGLNLNRWHVDDELGEWMQSYYLKPYLHVPHDKCFARKGERAYYSINDQLLYADLDAVTDISTSTSGDGVIRSIALKPDTSPFIYQLAVIDSTYNMTVKDIDVISGAVNYETSLTVPTMINDICVLPNGRRLMARYEEQGQISLWEMTPQNVLNHVEDWQMDVSMLPTAERLKTCRIYMLPSDNDRVEIFFYIPADVSSPGSTSALYHSYASFPVSSEDDTVPEAPAVKFTAYPNPMRDELKLRVENAIAASLSIDVYNIRGQLVRSIPLANQTDNAKIEYTWSGTDANHKRVANGIYLLRLLVNNKAVVTKRICRY